MKINFKVIFAIIFIFLFVLLGICVKDIYNSLNTNTEIKTISAIDKYGYELNENDSNYFQELFKELEDCLNEEQFDEEEYAKLVSKLFVVDFYSLKYALSKNDIGGIQFIDSELSSSFIIKAKDTIYSYVESNIYGKREQILPNVVSVEINSIETKEYINQTYQDENAYFVNLNLIYEENLGYPEEVNLVLVHKDNKLEIVKVN